MLAWNRFGNRGIRIDYMTLINYNKPVMMNKPKY